MIMRSISVVSVKRSKIQLFQQTTENIDLLNNPLFYLTNDATATVHETIAN